ncbi:hypothetical protein ACQPW1_11035 [Nocardia sp. CA-128927]|uniref:hypothetical protein n=1 Tax=Nocardia sp. CA-128927 TaxID=3239975 RepID=UPI003D95AA54
MAGKVVPSDAGADMAARRLQQALRLRAGRWEAVGILRSWGAAGDVLDELSDDLDSDREAARLQGVVDSVADHDVDPDFEP